MMNPVRKLEINILLSKNAIVFKNAFCMSHYLVNFLTG